MKLVPSLPPINAPSNNNMAWLNASDLLWRYPAISFHSPSPYSHMDFKTHLPATLGGDPRLWSREDVVAFLRWAEYEFDLPTFDLDMFQMNGKALCLLTKADLGERSPGSGDVLHNVIQMLIRDSRTLPSSPLTPHFPLTPSWTFSSAPAIEFPPTPTTLNSVTLSPAPSVDSQAGSPRHTEHLTPYPALNNYNSSNQNGVNSVSNSGSGSGSSGSNQSDSEVEESPKPPATPTQPTPRTPPPHSPYTKPVGPAFFPSEPVSEPNTNGRLLWDFLQQLLNDSMQRYTAYIAWKNRELGVFKIVDPPGLAKLWGIQKNHLSMNYDKMSRALRYYYRVNILRKVQGERHCYQFLRNPSELKSIKNISLLRQQMNGNEESQRSQQQAVTVKSEPVDTHEDECRPTDLSMGQHFRVTADFEYLRNPSELKIMKNLHMLREQWAASAGHSSSNHDSHPRHQTAEPQPRDLSVHPADTVQLSPRHQAAEALSSQSRDLSVHPADTIQLSPRHQGAEPLSSQSRDLSMHQADTVQLSSRHQATEPLSSQPRDLSVHPVDHVQLSPRHQGRPMVEVYTSTVGKPMHLSLSLETEQLTSRPQDLSLTQPPPPPLIKAEQCDRT